MSPRVREVIYGVWAWASFVLGILAAGFGVLVGVPPTWLVIALTVSPLIGSQLGFLAKRNVTKAEPDSGYFGGEHE